MNVILFGATGMLGQGTLRECLEAADVESVLAVGRKATTSSQPKVRDLLVPDLTSYTAVEAELTGYDACFFCLGVTSAGMSETDYRRVTYDIAVAAAQTLARLNPSMTFVFISGAGADSTEKGRTMWARVKGAAENVILKLPFRASYVLRPSIIQPLDGITSRTMSYRIFYAIFGWILPLINAIAPGRVATTRSIGRAMLNLARTGDSKRILDNRDINRVASIGPAVNRPTQS